LDGQRFSGFWRERPLLHKLSPGPAVLLVTPRDILKTPNSGLTSSGDLSCVGGSCVQTGSAFFSSGSAQVENGRAVRGREMGQEHPDFESDAGCCVNYCSSSSRRLGSHNRQSGSDRSMCLGRILLVDRMLDISGSVRDLLSGQLAGAIRHRQGF